jgi:hypothetical protein
MKDAYGPLIHPGTTLTKGDLNRMAMEEAMRRHPDSQPASRLGPSIFDPSTFPLGKGARFQLDDEPANQAPTGGRGFRPIHDSEFDYQNLNNPSRFTGGATRDEPDPRDEAIRKLQAEMAAMIAMMRQEKAPRDLGRRAAGLSDNTEVLRQLAEALTLREHSKLPQMTLTEFSGNHEAFTAYWDTFYCLVHATRMPKMQKLNHLITSLKGPAAAVHAGYKHTAENYDVIVDRLKDKYGNKRLLLSILIRKVLFKPQANKMTQARAMVDFLWATTRQLECEEVIFTDPAANLMLLAVYESKIPEELLKKWELHVATKEEAEARSRPKPRPDQACAVLTCSTTVNEFLNYCDTQVQALESAAQIHADGANPHSAPKPKAAAAKPAAAAAAPVPKPAAAAGSAKAKKKKTGAKGKKKPAAGGLLAEVESDDEEEHMGPGALASNKAPPKMTLTHYLKGCVWCGANHAMKSCGALKALPIQERWERLRQRTTATKEDICFQCFGDHKATECQSPPCGINGCSKRHSKLLHAESNI